LFFFIDKVCVHIRKIRGSSFVQHRPLGQLKPLDVPADRFLASVRFEHRSKLDQMAIEIGSLDTETGK
jgi:hypothetical protein